MIDKKTLYLNRTSYLRFFFDDHTLIKYHAHKFIMGAEMEGFFSLIAQD